MGEHSTVDTCFPTEAPRATPRQARTGKQSTVGQIMSTTICVSSKCADSEDSSDSVGFKRE